MKLFATVDTLIVILCRSFSKRPKTIFGLRKNQLSSFYYLCGIANFYVARKWFQAVLKMTYTILCAGIIECVLHESNKPYEKYCGWKLSCLSVLFIFLSVAGPFVELANRSLNCTLRVILQQNFTGFQIIIGLLWSVFLLITLWIIELLKIKCISLNRTLKQGDSRRLNLR